MSNVGNPQSPRYAGVDTENPRIKEYLKNCAKQNMPKEQAKKIVGMPMEIVDKAYREVKEAK